MRTAVAVVAAVLLWAALVVLMVAVTPLFQG